MAHRSLRRCRGAHRDSGRGAGDGRGARWQRRREPSGRSSRPASSTRGPCSPTRRPPTTQQALAHRGPGRRGPSTRRGCSCIAARGCVATAGSPTHGCRCGPRAICSSPSAQPHWPSARGASCAPAGSAAASATSRRGTSSRRRSPRSRSMAATGAVEPRDRRAALPLASDRRGAPVPDLPQARRDVARAAAHGPRRRARTERRSPALGMPAADLQSSDRSRGGVRSLGSDRPAAQTPPPIRSPLEVDVSLTIARTRTPAFHGLAARTLRTAAVALLVLGLQSPVTVAAAGGSTDDSIHVRGPRSDRGQRGGDRRRAGGRSGRAR